MEKPLWLVSSGDRVGLVPPGEGPPRGAVSAEHQRVDGAGPTRPPDALPSRAGPGPRLSPGSHGQGWEGSEARLGLPRGKRVPVTPRSPGLLTAQARARTRLRGRLSFDCPARPDQALGLPSVWSACCPAWGVRGKAAVIPGTWRLSPSGKQNKTSLRES